MPYHPNAELVAIHWAKGVAGVPTDKIGTTLPDDSVIADEGFIQIQAVGGVPDMYTGMQRNRIQFDFYGYNSNSRKLPWGKTYNLAMLIKEGTKAGGREVTTPSAFNDARVRAVIVETDPRRVTADEIYARYSMDVTVHWTEITN